MRIPSALCLGDLVSSSRQYVAKQQHAKVCTFCLGQWEPRTGIAAKVRDYCYGDRCVRLSEQRKTKQRREKYWLLKVPVRK